MSCLGRFYECLPAQGGGWAPSGWKYSAGLPWSLVPKKLGVRHFSRFSRSGLTANRSAAGFRFFHHRRTVSSVTALAFLRRYSVAVRHNLHRYYGAGDLHFITCSCYRRQPMLGSPRRRDLFLKVLEQARKRYAFVVVGYVVMPEHIHLLMSEPQAKNPSTVMQALKLGFARRVLARQRRRRNPSQASLFEHAPQHVWAGGPDLST